MPPTLYGKISPRRRISGPSLQVSWSSLEQRDHLRRRRDRVGVELLEPVDVREDAAQLLGIELFVAGLEAQSREHGDMTDLVAC